MTLEELYMKHEYLARETLFRMFPSPISIAKKHRLEFDDLLQYAKTGLWIATTTYDNTKKATFMTHAINHIRWHVKERLNRECCLFKLNSNKHDWSNMYDIISMDDKGDETHCLHEIVRSDTNVESDVVSKLKYDDIMNKLTDRQKKIVNLRVQGDTLQQIGEKLNLSKERVRQLLNETIENGVFGEENKNKRLYSRGCYSSGRKVCVNGKTYETIKNAAKELNIKPNVIFYRLNSASEKFKEWKYIS